MGIKNSDILIVKKASSKEEVTFKHVINKEGDITREAAPIIDYIFNIHKEINGDFMSEERIKKYLERVTKRTVTDPNI